MTTHRALGSGDYNFIAHFQLPPRPVAGVGWRLGFKAPNHEGDTCDPKGPKHTRFKIRCYIGLNKHILGSRIAPDRCLLCFNAAVLNLSVGPWNLFHVSDKRSKGQPFEATGKIFMCDHRPNSLAQWRCCT